MKKQSHIPVCLLLLVIFCRAAGLAQQAPVRAAIPANLAWQMDPPCCNDPNGGGIVEVSRSPAGGHHHLRPL